jgi:DeoR family transcriptional regulator of aga operon
MIVERGFLRVSDASAELGVSEVTVRADLNLLESAGAIVRVHGGAMPLGGSEPTIESSLGVDAAAKAAIGRAAAQLVRSGSAIYVDAGSTSIALAHALVDRVELRDLVIVTPGLTIALTLEPAVPRFTVIVTGGTLRPLQHSLVNPFAAPMLDSLNLDLAFIGCNGVDVDAGVTNVNLPEAEIKTAVMRRSARSVVLADASKLGRVELARIAPLADFEALVTDGELDAPGLRVVRS